MKYLSLIFIAVLSLGCTSWSTNKVFWFKKGDKVTYTVHPFYEKVCNGTGTIDRYITNGDGQIEYHIETNDTCAENVWRFDYELKLVGK